MMGNRRSIALIIWWCEGTKARKDKRWKNAISYSIEVTNTNYQIIKIFADFLRDDLGVPNHKLHGQIQIHEEDNKEKIERFWTKTIGIARSQLNKTIIRPKGNRIRKNNGTFKLRVFDKNLYIKLDQLLKREIEKISGYGSVG